VFGANVMGFHKRSTNDRQDTAHGKIPHHGKFPFLLTAFKENSPALIECV
jgi:hypothetical protein